MWARSDLAGLAILSVKNLLMSGFFDLQFHPGIQGVGGIFVRFGTFLGSIMDPSLGLLSDRVRFWG